ncbi:hypothetical protein KORDIASMS9_01719 [Kordia sp. SMS9]|uniref:hypothetical protein n=1 Tax=Kordia sp. SMS9 TaxID=2282170 RepID=UPI000E109D52|nr:hypothetical protein [Kordia sp. SMS9]AXG69496.1 hypothetical protein KORDIASMS9_01719 [Kordia sp. SMS9]
MKYLYRKNSAYLLCCFLMILSTSITTAQTTTTFGTLTYTAGGNNSYFGYAIDTSSSNNNVAMGYRVGNNSSSNATTNTSIGAESGLIGSRNVFFGAENGNWLTQGSNNVFIGNCSSCNTLGYADQNVFVGDRTGSWSQGNTKGNVFIGYAVGSQVGTGSTNNDKLIIDNNYLTTPLLYGDFSADKLGINTTNLPNTLSGVNLSNYSLYIKGGLLTEEFRISTGWADYVFDEGYQLLSLSEVEAFIDENGHLPNVPSAEVVEKTGIEMGDIKRIQQEKIEELTLYVIDLNEQLQAIKAELAAKKAAKKMSHKN